MLWITGGSGGVEKRKHYEGFLDDFHSMLKGSRENPGFGKHSGRVGSHGEAWKRKKLWNCAVKSFSGIFTVLAEVNCCGILRKE